MEHGHERCDLVPEILHLRRRELGGRIALLLLRVRAGLVGGVACVPRLSDTPRRRVLHHTGVAWRGVALGCPRRARAPCPRTRSPAAAVEEVSVQDGRRSSSTFDDAPAVDSPGAAARMHVMS